MNRKPVKPVHISIVRRTELHRGPNGSAYVQTVSAALMLTDGNTRSRLVAVGYGEDVSEAVGNLVLEHRINRLSTLVHRQRRSLEVV